MRVLVVGAGATGGYFGGRLVQAGRDVTFLVRADRADRLRARGLRIVSPHGDATIDVRTVTRDALARPYDLVVLGVKTYALDAAIDDIEPAIGPSTAILPLQNGMRHVDVLVDRFGERAVLGGVCMVATTFEDDDRIVQLNELQEIVFGERDGTNGPRVDAIGETLEGAGFSARASARIVRDMWEKWVMLAALGSITCSMRGTIGDVVAVPGGEAYARAVVDECAAVAAAELGAPLDDAFVTRVRAMLTAAGSPLTSSMYRDLTRGNPVEADAILGDLVRRAEAAGAPVPHVAAAYANLCVYRRRRDGA